MRGLTLLGTVALVVGNMVGTSIYTLPASLAEATGPLGLVAWGLTAFGYLFVALVYASLGVRYPRTGGPYVFAREAFGEFAGFQTVWSYWISAVIGNAAITTGVVAYAISFSPTLSRSVPLQFALVDDHAAPEAGAAGKDVFGDAQLFEHLDFLRHVGDAGGARRKRGGKRHRLAIEQDGAGIGARRMHAVEDFDESGLAGAVLPEQGVDLTGRDGKVDPAQRRYARKRLDDVARRDERTGL